ncbi:MAG: alpha/beta fold hydrolase [Deltaproteobacteria bacterium]|nr:alpha/beta fold hydrolase [Deltaproteobacteria bacterium]
MKLGERLQIFTELLRSSPALGPGNIRRLHAELGIGPTPCRVIHEERSFRLLHFPAALPAASSRVPAAEGDGDGDGDGPPPLLLVPSLINRWYVLDLLAGHSLVEALVAAGLQVYVIAWADAHDGQAGLGLDHVVESLIHRAVLRTCRHAASPAVTLLGQCLGGTLALAYAALQPERVDRLVALTTPVDFSAGGLLATWISRESMDMEAIARAYPGRVPDRLVYGAFPLLDPRALVTRHRLLFQNLHFAEFRRVYQAIDLWTTDHLPVASGVLRGMVHDLYQENAFWTGRWRMGKGMVRLEDVRCPLLNVIARADDIVPLAAAKPLLERVGSTVKEEFLSPLGHVTLILGSPLRTQTYARIAGFCARTGTGSLPVS